MRCVSSFLRVFNDGFEKLYRVAVARVAANNPSGFPHCAWAGWSWFAFCGGRSDGRAPWGYIAGGGSLCGKYCCAGFAFWTWSGDSRIGIDGTGAWSWAL